jgi:hypothetical protein
MAPVWSGIFNHQSKSPYSLMEHAVFYLAHGISACNSNSIWMSHTAIDALRMERLPSGRHTLPHQPLSQ